MASQEATISRHRSEFMPTVLKCFGMVSEFKDGDHQFVVVEDNSVGIFRNGGQFYAYGNWCPHLGGPVCEGRMITSDTQLHIVCPWHGYEFDLRTGECVFDPEIKLLKYDVIQKGDDLYVVVPSAKGHP